MTRGLVAGWLFTIVLAGTSLGTPVTAAEQAPATPETPTVIATPVAAAIPAVVGGQQLEPVTFNGRQALLGAEPGDQVLELLDLAQTYGQSVESLTLAAAGVGGTRPVSVLGARWPGVPATELTEVLVPLVIGPTHDASLVADTVAGREVLRVVSGSGAPDDVYVLGDGDTVWFVVAVGDDLDEIITALP